ncbi:HAD family hydrolase [Evansella clarkii]|uniref:HAD family hydrolase n=1 Tax=Evansella clarkii TaxID=79879 RepID=UPI0009989A7B|nr:HAD-IA family hydrolase [Evansella clarkii]
MIKALIFDCDGLLIDTETVQYHAFCEIYESHGLDLPLDLYVQCVGSSFADFDPFNHLKINSAQNVDLKEMQAELTAKITEAMKKEKLRSGVQEYLESAKEKGLKLGIASSSTREWVLGHLEKFDIIKYFDVIHTRDDVEKVKPDPELYNKTLSTLGVHANETIIFEDSLNGLKAAKAAGASCVIVPNKVTAKLPFENHDIKLNSMSDRSLEELINEVVECYNS